MNRSNNSIINAIANHNCVVVPRNCAERQERWKKVAERIGQLWEEMISDGTWQLSYSDALKQVINDPAKNEGLSFDDLAEHAMGCGCCYRHASGINGANSTLPLHVRSVSNAVPTTTSVNGKPCDCQCRHLVRSVVRCCKGQHP
jgi:hypothetical protein